MSSFRITTDADRTFIHIDYFGGKLKPRHYCYELLNANFTRNYRYYRYSSRILAEAYRQRNWLAFCTRPSSRKMRPNIPSSLLLTLQSAFDLQYLLICLRFLLRASLLCAPDLEHFTNHELGASGLIPDMRLHSIYF
jgi:hypothetical protein